MLALAASIHRKLLKLVFYQKIICVSPENPPDSVLLV